MEVKKAIIPAAGMGTRMLPITKTIPKELLPVNGKPMIQYSVEQVVAAGLNEIAIVINKDKEIIRQYFSKDATSKFIHKNKIQELYNLLDSCQITYFYQPSPLGLADAIDCARSFIGNEPFALLLPDAIFASRKTIMLQLVKIFKEFRKDMICLINITADEATGFGNTSRVEYEKIREDVYKVVRLYDKGPGSFKMMGQKIAMRTFAYHILLPHYFDYIDDLKKTTSKGELDDIPLLQRIVREDGLIGALVHGKAFDVGNPIGYASANLFLSSYGDARTEQFGNHKLK